MPAVGIDAATGCLLVGGRKVFPLGLGDAPPLGSKTPTGRDAWAEIAGAGVNLIRSGRGDWSLADVDAQLAEERTRLDTAAQRGLLCWTRLGDTAGNLPPSTPSPPEQLLTRIVGALKDHPALAVWKGVDEPANPNRPTRVPAAGLVRAYKRLKALDPDHPVTITQAPLGTVASLTPYRPAFDLTGADIYPVSYPPGVHSDLPNKDVSVVGDVTRKMAQAAGRKPVWTTLQIAWGGVAPSRTRPDVVPRFPTLLEERFMAYQSIVAGARGLVFFGGHLTQVMRPVDAGTGWNWTFWQLVLKQLVTELSSTAVGPALVAPAARTAVTADAAGLDLVTRQEGDLLWVIAVRRDGGTSRVRFSGLPARRDGSALAGGQVLFEYAQDPPPPPLRPDRQAFRSVTAANGSFTDWLGPHDARVYRFNLV